MTNETIDTKISWQNELCYFPSVNVITVNEAKVCKRRLEDFMDANMASVSPALSIDKICPDVRPNDYTYVLLSQHVYGGDKLKENDELPFDSNWKVYKIRSGRSAYFGAIYRNDVDKQLVLSHRGTNSIKAVWEDIQGIFRNKTSTQKEEAFVSTAEAIELVKQDPSYHLSFTGHSLGAFLAELSVFYAHTKCNFSATNAVTFDSPGSKESMEALDSNLSPCDLKTFDIIGYVSYPNLVNTCNRHVGTLYQVEPPLSQRNWLPFKYLKESHSIAGFVEVLSQSPDCMPKRYRMKDWPLFLTQHNSFFKYAKFDTNRYFLEEDFDSVMRQLDTDSEEPRNKLREIFLIQDEAHYAKHPVSDQELPLCHFSPNFQEYLRAYYYNRILHVRDESTRKEVAEQWRQKTIPEHIINYLLGYRLVEESSGIAKLVLDHPLKAIDFRFLLSEWLSHPGNSVSVTLPILQQIIVQQKLPEIWSVDLPPKNNEFVGRSDLLGRIKETLLAQTDEPLVLTAIHGLGGVGKTQLALKFMYENYKRYQGVIWFNAENLKRLQKEYDKLDHDLHILNGFEMPIEEKAKHVKRWLEHPSREDWLLVYDNAWRTGYWCSNPSEKR